MSHTYRRRFSDLALCAGQYPFRIPAALTAGSIQVIELREVSVRPYRHRIVATDVGTEYEVLALMEPTLSTRQIGRLSARDYQEFAKKTGYEHHKRFPTLLQLMNGAIARNVCGVTKAEASSIVKKSPYAPGGWEYIPPDHGEDFRARARRRVPKQPMSLTDLVAKLGQGETGLLHGTLAVSITYEP